MTWVKGWYALCTARIWSLGSGCSNCKFHKIFFNVSGDEGLWQPTLTQNLSPLRVLPLYSAQISSKRWIHSPDVVNTFWIHLWCSKETLIYHREKWRQRKGGCEETILSLVSIIYRGRGAMCGEAVSASSHHRRVFQMHLSELIFGAEPSGRNRQRGIHCQQCLYLWH